MDRSLSIVLPVHNAETTLHRSVLRLLDLAAELSQRFEVLIVDDGSTDHTMEVAHALTLRYPQVTLARHGVQRGLDAIIRTAMARSSGEVVCLHEGQEVMETRRLRRLFPPDRVDVRIDSGRAAQAGSIPGVRRWLSTSGYSAQAIGAAST